MTLFRIPLNVSNIKGSSYLLSFDNFGALVVQSLKEQSKDTAHLMFWVRCTLTGRINESSQKMHFTALHVRNNVTPRHLENYRCLGSFKTGLFLIS